MKKFKLLSLLILLLFVLSIGLTGCEPEDSGDNNNPPSGETPGGEIPGGETPGGETPGGNPVPPDPVDPSDPVDYAGQIALDMNSDTVKATVTVKNHVDGDTVHFNIDEPSFGSSVLKARFLAVNTPESTGQIEEYGKQASEFTRLALADATSIIIESDNNKWNADSTGGRFLVWIWYRKSESESYRNLNIELLQNGLAIASNSDQNRYGEICMAAINQALSLKLKIHSDEKDPLFFYGEAYEIDLKELRTNIEEYVGKKVAFEAVIHTEASQTLYVEEYFPEDDVYYGIAVYYGFTASAALKRQFAIGNRVRFVGTVSEFNGNYQISGCEYDLWDKSNPANTAKISENNPLSFLELTTEDLTTRKVSVEKENEDGEIVITEYSFAHLSQNSSVSMNNLEVISVYTTVSDTDSNGAMTLTCKVNGVTIKVRTDVLRDSNGNVITESAYKGKNISVTGMIEQYNGEYQIKIFFQSQITVNN